MRWQTIHLPTNHEQTKLPYGLLNCKTKHDCCEDKPWRIRKIYSFCNVCWGEANYLASTAEPVTPAPAQPERWHSMTQGPGAIAGVRPPRPLSWNHWKRIIDINIAMVPNNLVSTRGGQLVCEKQDYMWSQFSKSESTMPLLYRPTDEGCSSRCETEETHPRACFFTPGAKSFTSEPFLKWKEDLFLLW